MPGRQQKESGSPIVSTRSPSQAVKRRENDIEHDQMQNLIGTRYVGELLSYFTNIKCNIHCQHERTFSEKRFLPLVFTQAASVHGVHCILTLGSSSRNLANTLAVENHWAARPFLASSWHDHKTPTFQRKSHP